MDRVITALPVAIIMFLGILTFLEIGHRLGRSHLARDPQHISSNSSVDSAAFALYGLILAFTLSGAPARLDTRRQLIAQEANAIGTAYLRLDLLPQTQQPAMRQQLRDYLDSRLETFRRAYDLDGVKAELARSTQLQKVIWEQAVAATRSTDAHPDAGKLLLPALNAMIDITTTRTMAARIHPPPVIYLLLLVLTMVCSMLAGYAMAFSKRRSWLHIVAFTAIAVITVFVILEIEYPRVGFINVETKYDQVLIDLRQSME